MTTAGVLAGLSGAVGQRQQVILAALASTAAGALSMGAGAYLGTRAETEVIRSELKRTREEVSAEPYIVQESLLGALSREGLGREAAYRVVKLLSTAPEALNTTAEEKIYGLANASLGNAVLDGLLMGVAFLIGALVPLLPFVFASTVKGGLIAGITTTAVVLFAVGYLVEGRLARQRHPSISGVRFLGIAVGAAIIGYFIGRAISPLGGAP